MDTILKFVQIGFFAWSQLLQLVFFVACLVVIHQFLHRGNYRSLTAGLGKWINRVFPRPAYKDFSDHALEVMQRAAEEAGRLKYEYVGTEHVLLALLLEPSAVVAKVFKNLAVPGQDVRKKIEAMAIRGSSGMTAETVLSMLGKLPQTPRVERAIGFAREEARGMGHRRIDAEHLLIGIARTEDGVAAHILSEFGLEADLIRDEVLKVSPAARPN